MSDSTPAQFSYECKQGDAWPGEAFELKSADGVGYWANPVAKAQLRSYPEGALLYTFPFPDPLPVTDQAGLGVLTVGYSMPPEVTRCLSPGTYRGDLVIKSDVQPEYTFVEFTLVITERITRDCAC